VSAFEEGGEPDAVKRVNEAKLKRLLYPKDLLQQERLLLETHDLFTVVCGFKQETPPSPEDPSAWAAYRLKCRKLLIAINILTINVTHMDDDGPDKIQDNLLGVLITQRQHVLSLLGSGRN
jgi:hypothetical protein